MRQYELAFVTDPIDEAVEMDLVSEVDAFVGGHDDVTIVTITVPGLTILDSAHRAYGILRAFGIHPRRFHDDIVNRSQIASRLGTTPQAVGLWARGERKAAHPFPQPHLLAGGGLWRWQEVAKWLAEEGKPVDDLLRPTALEAAQISLWLAAQLARDTMPVRQSVLQTLFECRISAVAHQSGATSRKTFLDQEAARNAKRTDFALAL